MAAKEEEGLRNAFKSPLEGFCDVGYTLGRILRARPRTYESMALASC